MMVAAANARTVTNFIFLNEVSMLLKYFVRFSIMLGY